MLESLIENQILYIPFPTLINSQIFSGSEVPLNVFCRDKCKEKKCRDLTSDSAFHICRTGAKSICKYVGDNKITVFGIVDDYAKLPKYKEINKHFRGTYTEEKQVLSWFDSMEKIAADIQDEKDDILSKALHSFHDTSRFAKEIHNITTTLINQSGSGNFVEKLNQSSKEYKTLYKASTLLLDTYDHLNIYFNPASAKYGKPKPIEIYKMIDKLTYVLNMASSGSKKVRFKLNGHCHRIYQIYESFKFVPLAFMQNAYKYSTSNEPNIDIMENGDYYEFSFNSVGPLIEESEKEEIFQKEKRGRWAQQFSNDGMGIGLYIAKVVADIHNVELGCESVSLNYEIENIPQAENRFFFCLPINGEVI